MSKQCYECGKPVPPNFPFCNDEECRRAFFLKGKTLPTSTEIVGGVEFEHHNRDRWDGEQCPHCGGTIATDEDPEWPGIRTELDADLRAMAKLMAAHPMGAALDVLVQSWVVHVEKAYGRVARWRHVTKHAQEDLMALQARHDQLARKLKEIPHDEVPAVVLPVPDELRGLPQQGAGAGPGGAA